MRLTRHQNPKTNLVMSIILIIINSNSNVHLSCAHQRPEPCYGRFVPVGAWGGRAGVSDSVSEGVWAGGRRGGVMVLMYMCVCLCVNVRVGVYALFLSALCLILGMFNVFALIVNQF